MFLTRMPHNGAPLPGLLGIADLATLGCVDILETMALPAVPRCLTFFDTSADVTVTGGVPVENGGILLSTSTIQCVMKKTRYDASHALKSPKPTGAHMLKVIARMRKAPLAPTSAHSRARAASARARQGVR